MKKCFTPWTAGLLALTFASIASAHGDVKCEEIPPKDWKPQAQLQQRLAKQGWQVRQIKTYNGCYEVYGFDANGARAEAFFNPKTLDRVDTKQ